MSEDFKEKDYTTINFAVVGDLLNEWSSTCNSFKSEILKASENETFQKLIELDLVGSFPSKYDNAMLSVTSQIEGVISSASAYIQELEQTDLDIKNKIPKRKTPTTDEGDGVVGDSNTEINNLKAQLEFFKTISLSDLSEVLNLLNTIATDKKVSIDELLDDKTLGDEIKEKILQSVKISSEYKKFIEEGTTISSITALKSLINGKVPEAIGFDDSTTLVLKTYLNDFSSKNQLTYDELIGLDSNAKSLKTALNNLNGVSKVLPELDDDSFQRKINDIYMGDFEEGKEVDENVQSIIRNDIDVLSELSNIKYNDLLTNGDCLDLLKNGSMNLQRASVFANSLSNCKNVSKILSSLIK